MLAIKLQRVGKKHQPSYRVVVAEKRSKMAAPPVEDLGAYNPFTKAMTVSGERVSYWMKNGAQPTITVHNLFVEKGVLSAPKRAVKIKRKAEVAEGEAQATVPSATAPVAEEAASVAAPAGGTSERSEEPATTEEAGTASLDK